MTPLTRRGLMAGAAGSAALLAMEACGSSSSDRSRLRRPSRCRRKPPKPAGIGGITDPSKAPFDTVVVLMMENRSFDHLLGWMPGVNGKQAGLSFPGYKGGTAPRLRSAPTPRPAATRTRPHLARHGQALQQRQVRRLAHRPSSPATTFPIGYYEEAQVPILGALARGYTLFDAYHCSLMDATWPNRFYQLCAATDVDATGLFPAQGGHARRTWRLAIFDRLKEAKLTSGYYTWGEPMTELYASKKYDAITHPKDEFFTAAAKGTLPNVTFIDPDYTTRVGVPRHLERHASARRSAGR